MSCSKELFQLYFKTKVDFISYYCDTTFTLSEEMIAKNKNAWPDYKLDKELVYTRRNKKGNGRDRNYVYCRYCCFEMARGDKERMKDHVLLCKHYSIYEPFRPLRVGDQVFGKGFNSWINFSEYVRGETDKLIEKKSSVMKQERASYNSTP